MRIVAAIGGNALLRRGQRLDASVQRENAEMAAEALAPLARGHELIVTHGNGPQVGLLALETGSSGTAPYPLDVLGAESQGMIGYLLATALRNAIPGARVVTLLTEVIVSANDPAFQAPSKPIGPLLNPAEADSVLRTGGLPVAPDGDGYRRVVASPEPRAVVEIDAIRTLVDSGALVIAAGGGGIPLVLANGVYRGVEAVIDKDLTSTQLALDLHADWLLLLTDVAGVYTPGDPRRLVRRAAPAFLRRMELPAGSMGPKAEAACRFVERSAGRAAIGSIRDADAIVAGGAGTHVALGAMVEVAEE